MFRPQVEKLSAYVPGEQPQEAGWIKLNTNENPYPPSPRVVEAIQKAASGRLNIYPDPLGTGFRRAAAELFDLDPDWILPANGSDENLTILIRAFVDAGERICSPYPSYILYETLAAIQGAEHRRLHLDANWAWDPEEARELTADSKLVFIPNPNSPSGTLWSHDELTTLLPERGVLVLDEAYGDFVDTPHRMEILKSDVGRQIVVTRTLSKSYSLAGIRFGFAIAHPDLIQGMRKVKDSYNCDAISLVAAEAAIRDQDWMLANRQKLLATRTRLTAELKKLGWDVNESQANFVWMTRSQRDHEAVYQELKGRKILVRYMKFPAARAAGNTEADALYDGLRITVGTDAEIDALLTALTEIG